jgi:molybdenum cofactor biosynthesis enzyme MoaA
MLLEKTPLKSIDFSGGEPTIHPDFLTREFRLVKFTKKYPKIRFSLHSNGIELTPMVIDQIKDNFSRIGITVNSLDFEIWNKMTDGFNQFPKNIQKKKFGQIMQNIEYLGKQDIGYKVFIKSVVMRGVNDSEAELAKLMDFCAKFNFHPKLLQFEPQYPEQAKYVIGRAELFARLEKIGCKFAPDAPRHNNPKTYIPGVNFKYTRKPGAEPGLHSIFGCGEEGACVSCYDFLCMFVKPHSNIKGLYLKPCSVLDTRIDLTHAIRTRNYNQLIDLFKLSREYLMLAPGLGSTGWNKEGSYAPRVLCA